MTILSLRPLLQISQFQSPRGQFNGVWWSHNKGFAPPTSPGVSQCCILYLTSLLLWQSWVSWPWTSTVAKSCHKWMAADQSREPVETRPYWNYQDEISCYEGLISSPMPGMGSSDQSNPCMQPHTDAGIETPEMQSHPNILQEEQPARRSLRIQRPPKRLIETI